ncbi:hypothetical protein ACJIZ3_015797 [Penstemon smallii]|uniref:MADS-box domain-containing protein n=1 Tax=Penstemon smallii TaxID=265156 RepID=A0ABD3RPA8_9LAMI
MGRAKLNMELITKEKSRNITFKKRKEGLIRKMHEFTTLCDVSACMIIYGPKQDKGSSSTTEPEIWPPNQDEVRRIIDIYKAKNKESGNKTFGLTDFFHERKRKIEDELAKVRKKNMESKHPTWLQFLNFLTEPQLREFAGVLNNKSEIVKSRIELLKKNREVLDNVSLMDFSQSILSHHQMNLPLDHHHQMSAVPNFNYHHHPSIDYHSVNQNSMMMLLMNEGASSSGNIATIRSHVVYESSAAARGLVDPMMCHTRPQARYYAPQVAAAVAPQAFVPYPLIPGVVAPPQFYGGQEDYGEYQMKNERAI